MTFCEILLNISRNSEFAILQKLRGNVALSIRGLGGSVGTPEAGINASIIVVRSFEELEERSSEVKSDVQVLNTHALNGKERCILYMYFP